MKLRKREGPVERILILLAEHRRTVLCLVLAGIIAIGAGLLVAWLVD